MSPLDMLIFLFFILVTIKAVTGSIDYWKDRDEEASASAAPAHRKNAATASLSRTVRTGRPAGVRVTPIKRVDTPAVITASSRRYEYDHQYSLKDKGAA